MKFSITAASIFAFAFLSTAVRADSYSDAIKDFCDGLDVIAPTENEAIVAGQNTTLTVTRVPNDRQKTITGVDLYSVENETPKYIQNTWAGQYNLISQASISDDIPANVPAGYYYYRVWITNMMGEDHKQHGPDCIKFSRRFKVITGSHTNEAGFTSYAQSLDDTTIFDPQVALGCYGLSIQSPKNGDSAPYGSHVSIDIRRDSASGIEKLTKLEVYKVSEGNDELVDTVWTGDETLVNIFIAKDDLKIPRDKYDANASYYYKASVVSDINESCSFKSGAFKITE